jgi:hypothetical protein
VTDLYARWSAVREFRVVESDDPANYNWIDGKLVLIEAEPQICEDAPVADTGCE